jgi:hypothetical protein
MDSMAGDTEGGKFYAKVQGLAPVQGYSRRG